MTDFSIFSITKNYILCDILCVIYLTLPYNCLTQTKQFHCPDLNNTKFKVKADLDALIKIECFNIDYDELKMLLPCNISLRRNVRWLQIRNCPLPNDGSSINIIPQQLGLRSYKKLLVENNALTTNLSKYHLQDFYGLEHLTLRFKHLLYEPHELFADKSLKNLMHLYFYTTMQELPHNVFENLEKLTNLTIGHSIIKLPNGIFGKQSKLENLDLFDNCLQNITKDMFGHGSAIKTIDLQQNNIETLPSDVFELLTNLTDVKLKKNKIQALPENIFKSNVNLTQFILNENRADLIRLPQMLLANLPKLKEVLITCNLETVSETLFYNSKNIEKIILSYNKLKLLPLQLFATQVILILLDLSYNKLTNLTQEMFQNTTKLKTLILANNNIRTLERHLFHHLKNLEVLDLSNNQLTTNGFKPHFNTEHLSQLLIKNNSISAMDKLILYKLPLTKYFDLSNNNITKLFGKHLEKLGSCKSLNLTYNRIQTINLDDIEKMRLDNLNVDLNHNPLKCDCNLLGFIDYVKNNNDDHHLIININNLKCNAPLNLNETLVRLLDPKDLLCPYRNGNDCPVNCKCSIRPSDKTLILNCSNGTWTNIPFLPDIETNNLIQIELNMENNQLSELPLSELQDFAKVTKLLLAGNLLKTLNVETLTFFNESQTLKAISLSNNPLLCECDKTALYDLIQMKNTKFIDSADITCIHNLDIKYLKQLKDFCQSDSTIFILLATILTTIMLVVALFYKYQKEIRIVLYAHNACRWFVAEHELDDNKLYDAYVSYAQKDEEFVVKYLMPKLENTSDPFKLCIRDRDWLGGEYLPDKIVQSMADSKRTIVVLSKDYIQSEWSNMEFQVAHRATLNEGRKKLIIIKYNNVGEIENLNSDLKLYLDLKLYINWGDSLFWKRLRFEMPHTSV